MQVSIYGLIDPRTKQVFYVGKTVQPLKHRLQQHIFPARTNRKHHARARWIRSLLGDGVKPEITLLETVPENEWREAERRWIDQCKKQNPLLTNHKDRAGVGGTRSHFFELKPHITERLGKVADAVLADESGVTRKTIAYHRGVSGIAAAHDRTRNTPPPPMGGHNRKELSEAVIARFGKVSDATLAKEAGVSKKVIQTRRRALGIASYAEQTGNSGQFQTGHYPTRWLKK